MKTLLKLFITPLLAGWCSFGYAQTYEWQMSPKPNVDGQCEGLYKRDK